MPIKRLAPKDSFLHPQYPTPPGQLSASARWAELTDSPTVQEAVQVAFAEYVKRQLPEPATPGTMAYRIIGAKEVLEVLLNLGEMDKPVVKSDEKRLTPL